MKVLCGEDYPLNLTHTSAFLSTVSRRQLCIGRYNIPHDPLHPRPPEAAGDGVARLKHWHQWCLERKGIFFVLDLEENGKLLEQGRAWLEANDDDESPKTLLQKDWGWLKKIGIEFHREIQFFKIHPSALLPARPAEEDECRLSRIVHKIARKRGGPGGGGGVAPPLALRVEAANMVKASCGTRGGEDEVAEWGVGSLDEDVAQQEGDVAAQHKGDEKSVQNNKIMEKDGEGGALVQGTTAVAAEESGTAAMKKAAPARKRRKKQEERPLVAQPKGQPKYCFAAKLHHPAHQGTVVFDHIGPHHEGNKLWFVQLSAVGFNVSQIRARVGLSVAVNEGKINIAKWTARNQMFASKTLEVGPVLHEGVEVLVLDDEDMLLGDLLHVAEAADGGGHVVGKRAVKKARERLLPPETPEKNTRGSSSSSASSPPSFPEIMTSSGEKMEDYFSPETPARRNFFRGKTDDIMIADAAAEATESKCDGCGVASLTFFKTIEEDLQKQGVLIVVTNV